MKPVERDDIKIRQIGHLYKADPEYEQRIAEGLGLAIPVENYFFSNLKIFSSQILKGCVLLIIQLNSAFKCFEYYMKKNQIALKLAWKDGYQY